MDKQKLYESAPLWLQNIAVNVEGKIICKRRYNSHFFEELKHFEEHDYRLKNEFRQLLFEAKNRNITIYTALCSHGYILVCFFTILNTI